ncbi:hypothetical protein DFJ74DRAFT_704713 [Hyaloraphidium curvatum]|nr:hypothetical protein DFJ74DRAFT_704713 [Hyaloraphidium curvatum]
MAESIEQPEAAGSVFSESGVRRSARAAKPRLPPPAPEPAPEAESAPRKRRAKPAPKRPAAEIGTHDEKEPVAVGNEGAETSARADGEGVTQRAPTKKRRKAAAKEDEPPAYRLVQETVTLEGLPVEILEQIVGLLAKHDVRDALNLSESSAYMNSAVKDSPVWHSILRAAGLPEPKKRSRVYGTCFAVVGKNWHRMCEGCYAVRRDRAPYDVDGTTFSLCTTCRVSLWDPADDEELDAAAMKRITKTEALNTYRLSEGDLEGLDVQFRVNPHGYFAAPMQLFLEHEVVEVARRLHGGDRGIEAVQRLHRERSGKVQEKRAQARKSRKEELEAELAKHGLQVRGDSRLCEDYIKGGKGRGLREVVDAMVEMDWYFKHTNYETLRYEETVPAFVDYRGRMRYGRRTVNSELGKQRALEEFVRKRRAAGIDRSPAEDPPSPARPPETLWPRIEAMMGIRG